MATKGMRQLAIFKAWQPMDPKSEFYKYGMKIWNISNGASLAAQGCEEPVVEVRQANWQAYSPSPLEEGRSSNRPCPVSFSSDLTHLRVGSQMLRLDENERYRAVSGMDATSGMELCDYFEEFAARGNFIAIARRRTLVQPVADVPNVAGSSKDYKTNDPANAGVQTKDNVPDSAENSADIPSSPKSPGSISEQGSVVGEDSSSDTEDYCCTSSEEESDHNSAYESWSEGSTDIDWNCQDDDIGLDDDDDKSRTSHSSDSGSSRDEAVLSHGQLLDDYDGDGGVRFDFNDIRYPAHDYSSDEESHVGRFRATLPQGRKHSRTSPSQCSIAVYDSSSGSAVPLFRHSSRLTTELYESAPAFHPSRPLLVWPLCGGDILFADFQQKTYFVRNILPSARYTRHVSIKCRFSGCGQYLHIASLEAQQRPQRRHQKTADGRPEVRPTTLSIFVSTHRLSSRKTTRSPPQLLHRSKVALGEYAAFSLSALPIAVTWTTEHAYVTCNATVLNVYRISLFKQQQLGTNVMVPKHSIPLPSSAVARQVQYFPPANGQSKAMVFLSSTNNLQRVQLFPATAGEEATGMPSPDDASPPVGYFLDELRDLGGWGVSMAEVRVRPGWRDGGLVKKMQWLDTDDDCCC
ncbi:hypothetical protein H2203_002897 [Taxawa tesnikishii (nom. ined.)]|nr:hypothetical protein H2203_002897 [Dothideales sp. JES 119]